MSNTSDYPRIAANAVTVLWSGGFDSTALIIQQLLDHKTVHPLSVNLHNNTLQARAEARARMIILELLREEFPALVGTATTIDWPLVSDTAIERLDLPQPPIWVYAAAHAPTSDVCAGWVKGDDLWHYRTEVAALLAALNAFRQKDSRGQPTVLHTPFEWCSKESLLHFYHTRLEIFHAISSSEVGTPWSLGVDPKCREMQRLAGLLSQGRFGSGVLGASPVAIDRPVDVVKNLDSATPSALSDRR